VIQLEQLLRCKEEEEVGREAEAAAQVEVGRRSSVGLPPAAVRPQRLLLYCCGCRSGLGRDAELTSVWSSSVVWRMKADPRAR